MLVSGVTSARSRCWINSAKILLISGRTSDGILSNFSRFKVYCHHNDVTIVITISSLPSSVLLPPLSPLITTIDFFAWWNKAVNVWGMNMRDKCLAVSTHFSENRLVITENWRNIRQVKSTQWLKWEMKAPAWLARLGISYKHLNNSETSWNICRVLATTIYCSHFK